MTKRLAPKARRAPKSAARAQGAQEAIDAHIRTFLVPIISVSMPLLAVGFTYFAGRQLAHGGAAAYIVGFVATVVGGCLFGVSLRHCAAALRQLTRMPMWPSRILAVALDGAVVCAELAHALTPDQDLGDVALYVRIGVGAITATLNYVAFRAHQLAPRS